MTTRPARWTLLVLLGAGCATGGSMDMPPSDELQGPDEPYGATIKPSTQPAASAAGQMGSQLDCSVAPPSYADVTAFNTCVMCHATAKPAAQRNSAPVGVNFDTEAAALSYANEAAMLVMAGAMPPRASGLTLDNAEKQQLYTWAMCSTQ